jgi:hydroxymethylpyrimidine/phosphomethylpyrimidine kinase
MDSQEVEEADMVATVMSIAGFDPSGGAGLVADMKTIAAFRCHGAGAVAAVTVQDTRGVQAVQPVATDLLVQQVRAIAADMEVRAVKVGMLGSAAVVEEVTSLVEQFHLSNVVVDPVLTSTSGFDLLESRGLDVLKERLLPRVHVVTPNLSEAARLTGRSVTDLAEMKEAAREIHQMGARNVVVTGGHLPGRAVDVLYDGSEFALFDGSRVPNHGTHGLGCAFSSAVACGLARAFPVVQAVEDAKRYLGAALRAGYRAGRGQLLLDHQVPWDGGRRPA